MRGHEHNDVISPTPGTDQLSGTPAARRVVVSILALALLAGVMAQGTPFASAGRVFYVSASGSDANGGTLAAPFRTITHGLKVLAPGDTLYVRGGIYAEKVAPSITAGRSGSPVLVSAFPGESPLIIGSLSLNNASFWTIRGIDVLGGYWGSGNGGLVRFRGGTGWRFESSDVRRGRAGAGVVVTGGASNFTLRDLFVHDVFGISKGSVDLIRIDSGAGGNIERSLLVGSPLGAAVRLGTASSAASRMTVRYNTMYANLGPSNVVLAGPSSGNRIELNIMSLPGAGAANVTTSGLVGTGNEVVSNIGWDGASPLQAGIAGLLDRGGNLKVDPLFVDTANRDFHTLAPVAAAFGKYGVAADAPLPSLPTVSPTPIVSPTPTVSSPLPSPSPTITSSSTPLPSPPPIIVPTDRLYASSSFWNTVIPSSPAIDSGSASMVQAALVAYRSNSNFANTDSWGIPIVYARSTDKTYSVACTKYDCGTSISFRIPAGAKPTTGSDHHLVVIDGDKELDMWGAVYNSTADTWSASSRYVTSSTGWGAMCALGEHCNGAVAAGFASFGGIPRPEDFAGDVIAHALTITTPLTRSGIIACPATHTDGKSTSTSALPEGARVQLNPSFNVAGQSWPHWKKVIARTLQVYGAYVSDTGGTLAIRGEADLNRQGAWADAGVPEGANLSDLPWESMRVLDVTAC
jgi:hypothetical protein